MTVTSYKREQVVDIINSVIGRLKTPHDVQRDVISRELSELKAIIDNLRLDLHAARPSDISHKYIPSATDELDAVVDATEEATVAIMESCDRILDATRPADQRLFQTVEESVVRIFEACTFQDITGQRIKKVTNSLKQIDSKIKSVLSALDEKLVEVDTTATAEPKENLLLNGPALPSEAVSQQDIDKLLAEFDKVEC